MLDTAVLAMDSVGDMDKGSVGCSKAMDSMPAAADVGADSTFSEADVGMWRRTWPPVDTADSATRKWCPWTRLRSRPPAAAAVLIHVPTALSRVVRSSAEPRAAPRNHERRRRGERRAWRSSLPPRTADRRVGVGCDSAELRHARQAYGEGPQGSQPQRSYMYIYTMKGYGLTALPRAAIPALRW